MGRLIRTGHGSSQPPTLTLKKPTQGSHRATLKRLARKKR